MSAEEAPIGPPGKALERHPSLDDRFDPAIEGKEAYVAGLEARAVEWARARS